MGLFKFLLALNTAVNENAKEEKMKRLEKEMEWNHFDDYEKEEVLKGHYDIHNFEDSEGVNLDEDDYYKDDRM